MPGSKPPLSVEELRDIDRRSKGNEDVRRLLWEIKRLRDENEQLKQNGYRDYSIIARCYQIARSMPHPGGILGTLFDDLKRQLEGHPVREHQDGIMPALRGIDLDVKPGDDD